MEDNNLSNQGDKELIEKLLAENAALRQENQALRGNDNRQNICNTNDQPENDSNSSKNESSSKMLFTTYKKRSGTNDAGKEFEYMMCALYALKLCNNKDILDFEMTTNNEKYGDFDDISLEIQTENETKMFLLQLKHKENEKQYVTNQKLISAKSEFTLDKYLKSFEQLDVGDVTCFVYTNSPAKLENGSNFDIVSKKSGNFDETTMNVTVKKPQALGFLHLIENKKNLNQNDDNVFQFDIIQEGTTFSKVKNFCENFFLVTGQDNLQIVETTIKKMLTSLLKVDIYDSFIFFMKKWWSGRFVLTKRDVILKLVELAMSPWVQTVSSTNINGKSKLLSKAIMSFDMTIVKNKKNNVISNIWNDTIEMNELRKKTIQKFYIQENRNQKSKILWFFDKIPLIVKVNLRNKEKVKQCIKLLECLPQKKKLILVGNAGRGEFPKWNVFENLGDLQCLKNIYNKIIRRSRLSLQGRIRRINLEKLIINNQDFVGVIETDDLLEMTQRKWLSVGTSENSWPKCYIPRKVSTFCVNTADLLNGLRSVKKYVFIINCDAEFRNTLNTRYALVMELGEFLVKEKPGKSENLILLSIDKPCTYNEFVSVCKWQDNLQVYLFEANSDCCIYLMSSGHKLVLNNCRNEQIKETEIFKYFRSELNVIFAPPGMGKSTLFNVLSRNCPTDLWVVHVKLIDYNAFLATHPNEQQLLRHFLRLNKIGESLYTKMLEIYLQNKKILILLDGVDELKSHNVNHLLSCSKRLVCQGFHVWISSRANWQEKMSQDLKLFTTVNVVELTEDEQKMYIGKRLKNKYESCEFEEIIDATFKSSDIANSRQLIGIPLQLYIITENFLINESLFPNLREENIFLLTTMYKFFFEGKERFNHQKLNIDKSLEHQIGLSFEDNLKHYELPALKACLDNETFEKLQMDECEPPKFLENIERNGDKFGIIRYFTAGDKAVFYHQTYAEYFASVWFERNLEKVQLLKDDWFSEKYENLRLIFDIMLSGKMSLHLAVIYNNREQFRKYVDNSENDKAGRNAMFLACCYGMKYPLPKTLKSGFLDYKNCQLKRESENYVEIVHSLLERCQNIFEQDSLFGMSYVDYALSSRCLYVIEACLERKLLNFEQIEEVLQKYYKFETLAFYASQMNYVHLMKNVLRRVDHNITFRNYYKNFLDPNLQTKCTLLHVAIVGGKDDHKIGSKENVESAKEILKKIKMLVHPITLCYYIVHSLFIEEQLEDGGFLRLACELGRFKIMRLLLKYKKTHCGNNILHMTVSFGTLSNEVLELSKTIGLDINQKNQGKTPLYMACDRENEQFVKKLLKFGAQIDVPNKDEEENVFHAMAKSRKENMGIMQMLIDKMYSERKSLVNVPDKHGRCPLFLACERGHINYYNLLRQNGADVSGTDRSGNTVLHYSARASKENEEIINIVLGFCMDINHKNLNGEIALHLACANGIFSNVKVLINRGSDLNARSDDGSSCLHYAVQHYNENTETIKFLIDNNLQVNAQNNKGETPSNIACKRAPLAMSPHSIRILLENDADASIADEAGKSPLHNYFLRVPVNIVPNCEMITLLLSDKRVDLNAVDRDGNTVLNLSLEKKINNEITEVLLKNGADPNIIGKNGGNSLHYLCKHFDKNSVKNNSESINMMIYHGVNVNTQDNDGLTPLHLLLKRDIKETLIYVPQNYREAGVDEIAFDGHKMTSRHHEVDEVFLDTFSVNPNNVFQQIPPRKKWDAIIILLKSGADTNVMDNKGMTAIHYETLSCFDDAIMIKVLVDYGVNLNAQNHEGKTALHLALENKMYNKVEASIKFGADVNKTDNNKKSALHYAMNLSPVEESFLHLFLNYDADTKAHDLNLEKYAIEATCYDYVNKLLQKGFDINTKDVNGTSVLHYACMTGRLTNVEILLKTGANKYVINNNQQTILHYAAMSSNPEENIMNYLVETGVDIYAKDSSGRTALDVAFEYKCFKALQLLIQTNKFFNSTEVPWSTLLYYSAFGGCTHGIEYLIQNCDNISALDYSQGFSLEFLKSGGELQKEKLLQMTECVSHLIEQCGTGSTFSYEPSKFVELIWVYINVYKISEIPVRIFPSPRDYVQYVKCTRSSSSDITSTTGESRTLLTNCIRRLETIHL